MNLNTFVPLFEDILKKSLLKKSPSSILHQAMTYVLSSKGKRLRPFMVYQSALKLSPLSPLELWKRCIPSMLALEYVHTYSLIHDDLPCMDNDDYRRGKLSCHRQFGEANAILCGDALLSDAFDILSTGYEALKQIQILAKSIGSQGMVAGQVEDMRLQNQESSWPLEQINAFKTAKLFEAACMMGGICADASHPQLQNLKAYGFQFGLDFQAQDDLDDVKTEAPALFESHA